MKVSLPATPEAGTAQTKPIPSVAVREGRSAKEIARLILEAAGFTDPQRRTNASLGRLTSSFTAFATRNGQLWFFDVAGSFTSHRGGLKRTDLLWKAIGKAAVLREVGSTPLVLLTTDAPDRGTGAEALKRVVGPNKPIYAVIEMLKPSGVELLRALCYGERRSGP